MLKKFLLISLALLLTLSFVVACNGENESIGDENYETPVTELPDEDELYYEDDYEELLEEENEPEDDYEDLSDGEAYLDDETYLDDEGLDADVFDYPVVVDGVGVPGASLMTIGDDEIFPTHVSLMALDLTLGMDVFWRLDTNEASLTTLNGFASFTVGSAEFTIGGEVITLEHETVRVDEEIFVPISFFRDVYGAAGAYFADGSVFIDTEETDMH